LWRREGCYGEIARRLGYRLRLTNASFPRAIAAGSRIRGSFTVVNDGFAAPYNRRPVELVLRNRNTGRTTLLRLNVDPRRWTSGREHRLLVDAALPRATEPGTYDLLLNLPDPAQTLRNRPEYSIRLADQGTWESATGFNRLLMSLRVQHDASGL